MALFLNDSKLLPKLSTGDVISNELFYHKNCYKSYINKYRSAANASKNAQSSSKNINDDYIRAMSFNKIITYVYEKGCEDENISFDVSELERLYASLLAVNGIHYTSHVSRFADELVSRIPELEKRKVTKKKKGTKKILKKKKCGLTVFFKESIDKHMLNQILEPDSFMRGVRDVVSVIRKKMIESKNEFRGEFPENCQKDSVPIELLTLMSMLVDGNDISNQAKPSQGALTCSQYVLYNFKKVYHRQHRETPICLYNSLKIYATLRSETLINAFFNLGIYVPYKRVLEITKDLSQSLLTQFENQKVFLPSSARKNVFTVIAKDNIDLNSSSTTASSHYHGTCMSVIQFPTDENEGIPIKYKYDVIEKTTLKADKLPSEYTVAEKRNLCSKNDIYVPISTINLIDIENGLLKRALNDEKEWLSSYRINNNCWSSFHASKHRFNVKMMNDISTIMLLIREKVNTLDTQFHCMKIIKNTV